MTGLGRARLPLPDGKSPNPRCKWPKERHAAQAEFGLCVPDLRCTIPGAAPGFGQSCRLPGVPPTGRTGGNMAHRHKSWIVAALVVVGLCTAQALAEEATGGARPVGSPLLVAATLRPTSDALPAPLNPLQFSFVHDGHVVLAQGVTPSAAVAAQALKGEFRAKWLWAQAGGGLCSKMGTEPNTIAFMQVRMAVAANQVEAVWLPWLHRNLIVGAGAEVVGRAQVDQVWLDWTQPVDKALDARAESKGLLKELTALKSGGRGAAEGPQAMAVLAKLIDTRQRAVLLGHLLPAPGQNWAEARWARDAGLPLPASLRWTKLACDARAIRKLWPAANAAAEKNDEFAGGIWEQWGGRFPSPRYLARSTRKLYACIDQAERAGRSEDDCYCGDYGCVPTCEARGWSGQLGPAVAWEIRVAAMAFDDVASLQSLCFAGGTSILFTGERAPEARLYRSFEPDRPNAAVDFDGDGTVEWLGAQHVWRLYGTAGVIESAAELSPGAEAHW